MGDLPVNSLQVLRGAWNPGTPHPEMNLAGWSTSQVYPCGQALGFSHVQGLSILGNLPENSGNINTLTAL